MPLTPPTVLTARRFSGLRASYTTAWPGVGCCACGSDGVVALGEGPSEDADWSAIARRAIEESLRWGEPAMQDDHDGRLVWAVPLLANGRLLGGVVAWVAERRVRRDARSPLDVRAAMTDLRRRLESAELTNAALLAQRRAEADREAVKARAIDAVKRGRRAGVLEMWAKEEDALINALRRGDQGQARAALNRVLVGIYARAGDGLPVLKSLLLELVVTMHRTVAEHSRPGLGPLADDHGALSDLAEVSDEEGLARWLKRRLDAAIDALAEPVRRRGTVSLDPLRGFLEANAHRRVTRAEIARSVGLSPWRLSRRVQERFGVGLPTLVARARIDRARALLAQGSQSILAVALACGFRDHSHFTRVFRRQTGLTPREWLARR